MMLLALLLAISSTVPEGDVQAFPGLTDARGTPLAEGHLVQKVEGDVLHIEARYDFRGGRTVVERATLRLHPQLEQESWDWTERLAGQLVRQYEVDFRTKKAVATRADERKRWKEDLDIEPGKTFAGIGFTTVVKALRAQLAPGQHVDLRAVAFTPKPRTAPITITRDGADPVRMAGRADTGHGIPEGVKDKLFEPFVTSGKQDGTGLGLAIVKQVIEAHGGEVQFESTPGKGTTFTFSLPA
jgi:hypothetical protein